VSVEQVAPEGSALPVLALLTVAVILATEVRVLEALAVVVPSGLFLDMTGQSWGATHKLNRPFDQLVQFASIQPHASAGRAIVDLDALAIGHDEFYALADRTEHDNAFL
jgi:hypothetical protein